MKSKVKLNAYYFNTSIQNPSPPATLTAFIAAHNQYSLKHLVYLLEQTDRLTWLKMVFILSNGPYMRAFAYTPGTKEEAQKFLTKLKKARVCLQKMK